MPERIFQRKVSGRTPLGRPLGTPFNYGKSHTPRRLPSPPLKVRGSAARWRSHPGADVASPRLQNIPSSRSDPLSPWSTHSPPAPGPRHQLHFLCP